MARHHKPKAGSRAFWPRKRAKRIYPTVRTKSTEKEAKPLSFAAYKAGMTQVAFISTSGSAKGQEIVNAATVLDCPPLVVAGYKVYKRSPYGLFEKTAVMAEKLDKNLSRKTSVPNKPKQKDVKEEGLDEVRLLVHTKPRDAGIGKKRPELFEIDLSGDVKAKLAYAKGKLGQELKPEEVFKKGEYIDVRAISTGKGFQGPVKRFGIKVRSRKSKGKMRHLGTMGPHTPNRVMPGIIAQAGQMGFQARTEYNKRVLQIGKGNVTPKGGFLRYGVVEGPYMLLEGSVPGPKKRLIMLRKGLRAGKDEPVEVSKIALESQQGV